MKTWKLIALAGAILPLISVQAAEPQGKATQTPHQLNQDGATSAVPDAGKVTVAEADGKSDGANVRIKGVLEQKRGEDVYLLRDSSGQIDAVIPAAVLGGATVAPGDSVVVQGAIDKKQTPHRLRVSHFEKRK